MNKNIILNKNTKRFWERYFADFNFQSLFIKNPELEINKYNIFISPKEIKNILSLIKENDLNQLYYLFNQKILALKNTNKKYFPVHSIYKSWFIDKSIQYNSKYKSNLYSSPFTIELTKGCSVGCPFCGFSAGPIQGIYKYDKNFWIKTLLVLKKYCGICCARRGFFYWATDPFDNPEYENFILDFYKIFKTFPTTTTSQFTKDIKRSKNFIKLLNQITNNYIIRGSILSFNAFNKLHENFSAEELKNFKVLFQFDNILPKVKSGKFLNIKENTSLIKFNDLNETIACVTGFLINMVEKSIKLIIPCEASKQWPLGYKILASDIFNTPEDLDSAINKMINVDMIRDMMQF